MKSIRSQDLARQNVPTSLLTRNNESLAAREKVSRAAKHRFEEAAKLSLGMVASQQSYYGVTLLTCVDQLPSAPRVPPH
jgi:hypothetical protein